MIIGGVLLYAGMELFLIPGDYQDGIVPLNFTISTVVESCADWIVLTGVQHPTAINPWRSLRIRVRVAALKHSLSPHHG